MSTDIYVHGVGRVYASGGQSSIDISASNGRPGWKGRKVEISRTRRNPKTGQYDQTGASINPEAAALLATVLGDIDDWSEINDLARILWAASEYDGTQAREADHG